MFRKSETLKPEIRNFLKSEISETEINWPKLSIISAEIISAEIIKLKFPF